MDAAAPPPGLMFFFNDTATTEIYTLSLHDALPIYLRYELRGGNEEVGFHHFELPVAGARGISDALLGEHERDGRGGAVLRALGDGEDDAIGGCRAAADRRRRARLERARGVQFRGWLLRQ